MTLAEKRAVRFLHVISCTNMPKPLGMGLWEGVPLREVIWLAQPKTNIRRVYYYGYHNDDPKQRFQSSLPVSRVLEEPPGELPIILCYKLNGQWLTPKRGGPVRMIVPGAYGNKSVKWIQRVVLTNDPRQNDTYAEWNNDTDSHLKTCASFRSVPEKVKAGQAVPVAGVAQVGMSGLSKVQYWVTRRRRRCRPTIPTLPAPIGATPRFCQRPPAGAAGCPTGSFPPCRCSLTRTRASRANGRCATPSPFGPRDSATSRQGNTISAAAPLTPTAWRSRCPGHSPSRAITPFRKCL